MAKKTAPYGRWESPITSDLIVKQNISFGEIKSFFSAGATDAAAGRRSCGPRTVHKKRAELL